MTATTGSEAAIPDTSPNPSRAPARDRLAALLAGPVAAADVEWLKRPVGYLAALAEALEAGDDGLLDAGRHLVLYDELDDGYLGLLGCWPSKRAEALAQLAGVLRRGDGLDVATLRAVAEAFTFPHEPLWVPPERLEAAADPLGEALRHHPHPGLVAVADLLATLGGRSATPSIDEAAACSGWPAVVELTVLVDRHRNGEAAVLRVRAAPGPPGLFPDVASQPFTAVDGDFARAVHTAYVAAGAPQLGLRWSLTDTKGLPYDELVGPSIGLGAAVAVLLGAGDGEIRLADRLVALTGAVDDDGNVTTLLDDGEPDLSRYQRKLEAAGSARVLFPAVDAPSVSRRAGLFHLPATLVPVATVAEAVNRTLEPPTPVPAQPPARGRPAAVAVALALGALAVIVAVAALAAKSRESAAPTPATAAAAPAIDRLAELKAEVKARIIQVVTPAAYRQATDDGAPLAPTFGLSRTEVEAGWYARCVELGACQWGDGTGGAYPINPLRPSWPAVEVNAVEAAEFCDLMGGRLPRRSEWQAAALTVGRGEWPMTIVDGDPAAQPLPRSDPLPLAQLQSASDDGSGSSLATVYLVRNAQELTATTCSGPDACSSWSFAGAARPPSVMAMGITPTEYAGPAGNAAAAGRIARSWWTGDEVLSTLRADDLGFRCVFDAAS